MKKNDIMLKCLTQLSLVYGTSVNVYAQEKLYNMIDNALEQIFKDRFWDRHICKVKIDFVNGQPTSNQIHLVCRDFDDILTVITNDGKELPRANSSIIKDEFTGASAEYFQRNKNDKKVLQIIPKETCSAWVIFRSFVKPDVLDKFINNKQIIEERDLPFTLRADDEVPFDSLAIQYLVCHNYMIIKGDNRDAAQNFLQQYAQRIRSLKQSEHNSTISFDNEQSVAIQGEWWDASV